jgi:hypothetical protein
MTTTPQEPDPDSEPLDPGQDDPTPDHGEGPIPGEKQTPGTDEDDPEYDHESPRRVQSGETRLATREVVSSPFGTPPLARPVAPVDPGGLP